MGWSAPLVAATGTTSSNAATTGSLDTTGCDFFALIGTSLSETTPLAITDSKSNSWNALTLYPINSNNRSIQIHWSRPTSVGTGHTFTGTLSGQFPGIVVMGFSGSDASPYDGTENGNAPGGTVTTRQPGSITPSQADCLLITGAMLDLHTGANPDIGGGFTLGAFLPFTSGQSVATGGAYLIQTTANPANPTWSWSGAQLAAANIAAFRAAAATVPFAALMNTTTTIGGAVR
jgi:hypothetical protein